MLLKLCNDDGSDQNSGTDGNDGSDRYDADRDNDEGNNGKMPWWWIMSRKDAFRASFSVTGHKNNSSTYTARVFILLFNMQGR